ncbi:dGTPase family protein, partial [Vibrio parahaemolyticus V-223/04]
PLKAMRRLFAL